MPRQTSRVAPASNSTSVPKRRASTRLSSTSKKPKYASSSPESQSGKTTAKQSKYFEPESETSSHSDSDEHAAPSSDKRKELWREGVKTGLGPGKEVFIQKPKMRDDGGVPYHDESLHPNSKFFLLDLKENNERQWLKGESAARVGTTVLADDVDQHTMPSIGLRRGTGRLLLRLSQRRSLWRMVRFRSCLLRIWYVLRARELRLDTVKLTCSGISHPQRRSIQQGSYALQGMLPMTWTHVADSIAAFLSCLVCLLQATQV